MYRESAIIENESGLHARPAMSFVQAASKFDCKITMEKDGRVAPAKSLISILALGVGKGEKVIICAEGKDEEKAVKDLVKMIQMKFNE